MKLRISARSYLVLLLLSIGTAFSGLLYFVYENRIHDAREQALDQTKLFAGIASKSVDALHADLLRGAQAIATRPEAAAAMAGQGCGAWLSEEAAHRRLANIFLLNARHEPICSAVEPSKILPPPKSFLGRLGKPEARDRGAVGPFYLGAPQTWVFPVAFPWLDAQGNVAASVAVVVDADRLDMLREALVDRGAETSYIDAAGRVGLAKVSQANSRAGEMASAEVREAIASPERSQVVGAAFTSNARALLSGWSIFVSIPEDNVFGPLRDAILHQTLVLGVFCLFGLFGIWGIASRLSTATSVLVKAAGNVESLFASRSTGVSEIDQGLDEMKRSSRQTAKAQATIELWRAASQRTRSGMAVLRKASRSPGAEPTLCIELCNPAFEELSGMGRCLGKNVLRDAPSMSVLGDRGAVHEMRSCAQSGLPTERSGQGLDAGGRLRHVLLSLEPLAIEGSPGLFGLTLEDVTDIAEREAELEKQSTTDALTNLPNRALFTNLLSKSIAISQRNNSLCAVGMLDLDHFKFINDSIGHEMGDKVIAEVASRLAARLRPGDTVSRFGGDEFGIVFADVPNLETIASLVEHAREALEAPVEMSGRSFALTFSAGVSVFPHDGDAPKILLSCADIAMFQAKEDGRGNVKFHAKGMSEAFAERLTIEQALKAALADNSIQFLYQPKISLATGQPCGMEALARWSHPVLGDVSPSKFIPLAEESELIATLGSLAIRTALRDAKTLWDQGFRNMPVAINVSARQIKEGFTEKLVHALRESALPAQAVHVEITESSVMPNSEVTQTFLAELHRLGIKVALDDFGTGWSNMAMLKTLPLSYLKMDRSFIIGLGKDEKDAAIAKAIIGLAKALGVEVIAEGVETHMQAQQLVYLAADQIQGYYVCKPMPIEEVARWLHGGSVFQGAGQGPGLGGPSPIAPLSILGPHSA